MYAALGTAHSTISRYLTRQAVYASRLDAIAVAVDDYRRDHPGGGLVKIRRYLRRHDDGTGLTRGISRERFVAGMQARGRGLELTPPRPRTTHSGTQRFDNQTRGMIVAEPDRLWCSDTTYYRMASGAFCYLTFVLDVYTREILGAVASDSLSAEANVAALRQAIEARGSGVLIAREIGVVFHTDGGAQFTQAEFVATLRLGGRELVDGICRRGERVCRAGQRDDQE